MASGTRSERNSLPTFRPNPASPNSMHPQDSIWPGGSFSLSGNTPDQSSSRKSAARRANRRSKSHGNMPRSHCDVLNNIRPWVLDQHFKNGVWLMVLLVILVTILDRYKTYTPRSMSNPPENIRPPPPNNGGGSGHADPTTDRSSEITTGNGDYGFIEAIIKSLDIKHTKNRHERSEQTGFEDTRDRVVDGQVAYFTTFVNDWDSIQETILRSSFPRLVTAGINGHIKSFKEKSGMINAGKIELASRASSANDQISATIGVLNKKKVCQTIKSGLFGNARANERGYLNRDSDAEEVKECQSALEMILRTLDRMRGTNRLLVTQFQDLKDLFIKKSFHDLLSAAEKDIVKRRKSRLNSGSRESDENALVRLLLGVEDMTTIATEGQTRLGPFDSDLDFMLRLFEDKDLHLNNIDSFLKNLQDRFRAIVQGEALFRSLEYD